MSGENHAIIKDKLYFADLCFMFFRYGQGMNSCTGTNLSANNAIVIAKACIAIKTRL
jgi:hypothetical protein